MENKFNRQSAQFGANRKIKVKGTKNLKRSQPSIEDIELATKSFLNKGWEIERLSKNSEVTQKEVFRSNLEPDSRLGMGTLVDDS